MKEEKKFPLKKIFRYTLIVNIILMILILAFVYRINNFEKCVAAGNKIMDTNPRSCYTNGKVFIEKLDFKIEKKLENKCTEDSDCTTPGDYIMRTDCTYESKCFEGKCIVICPVKQKRMSLEQAREIAGESECTHFGKLTDDAHYNVRTNTWWIDINQTDTDTEKEGCNPTCVVFEQNKTAEINWRCTGLKLL